MTSTADLLDEHGERAGVCELELRSFGGVAVFGGRIATVRCFEDNVVVRRVVSEPGSGRVLVVDGGGSRRVALLGDRVAGVAAGNGWAGLVINGCVRDVTALRTLDLGIVAIGSTPRPSGKTGDGEVDVPLAFGGLTFRPGVEVFRDDDGLVVLER